MRSEKIQSFMIDAQKVIKNCKITLKKEGSFFSVEVRGVADLPHRLEVEKKLASVLEAHKKTMENVSTLSIVL